MMLQAALKYQEMGFSIIPVKQDKTPHIAWEKFQSERAGKGQIEKWWERWPEANIAIIAGQTSGVDVVDADSEKGRDALNEYLPDSLMTPVSETGKGWHYFFAHSPGLSNGVRVLNDCDVRTTGGYVIVPPSIHESGKKYVWLDGLKITDVKPAAMPGMLFDILKSGGATPADTSPQAKNGIKPYKNKSSSTGANITPANKCQHLPTLVLVKVLEMRVFFALLIAL